MNIDIKCSKKLNYSLVLVNFNLEFINMISIIEKHNSINSN